MINEAPAPSTFVYAIGTIDVQYPDPSIAEELHMVARAAGVETPISDDPLRSWHFAILSRSEARYLARQLTWLLTIGGQQAYALKLNEPFGIDDLISGLKLQEPGAHVTKRKRSARNNTKRMDPASPLSDDRNNLVLVIGSSSQVPVEVCPGTIVPILFIDQLLRFDRSSLLGTLEVSAPNDSQSVDAIFTLLVQTTDNFGSTDAQRALNFLAIRYLPLYQLTARMAASGFQLVGVNVVNSRLARQRRIVDPIFAFQDRNTGIIRRYFVRVDVTYIFPMIVSNIQEYFSRDN